MHMLRDNSMRPCSVWVTSLNMELFIFVSFVLGRVAA